MAPITQLFPTGAPGPRYGSFAGKAAAADLFLNDPAWAAQTVSDFLATTLSAELATIEAAEGDGIELGSADFWTFPQAHCPGELNVIVYPMRSEEFLGGDTRCLHHLLIEVVVAGEQGHATHATGEVLVKRAQRAAEAIIQAVNNTTLNNQVDRLFIQDFRYDVDDFDNVGLARRVVLEADVFTSTS